MRTYVSPSAKHLLTETDHLLEVSLFCDGAYDIKLPDNIQNCSIRLIHNNRCHDDWILLYLLIEQFAERACNVDLILPYISYGRQKPVFLQALLRPLQHPIVQKVMTFDLHQDYAGINNMPTASLIANDILSRGLQGAVLIAPDKGSIQRVERLGKLTNQSVIGLAKTRNSGQVSITSTTHLPQNVDAIIVDDMVDTGSTLKACVQHLRDHSLRNVHVYATHGVLSYGIGEWANGIASLTLMNTLPARDTCESIRWLDIRKGLVS